MFMSKTKTCLAFGAGIHCLIMIIAHELTCICMKMFIEEKVGFNFIIFKIDVEERVLELFVLYSEGAESHRTKLNHLYDGNHFKPGGAGDPQHPYFQHLCSGGGSVGWCLGDFFLSHLPELLILKAEFCL